jgi:hypothetical protein
MALKGRILPGYGDHRREPWRTFGRYCRALQARYGSLSPDALHWTREAGLLVVALDALHREEQDIRARLNNGAGRRARATARVALRQLERRAARLRASLEAAERRLEALAQPTGPAARVPTPFELLAGLQEASRAR